MVKTIDATTTDRLRRSPLYLDLSPSCARSLLRSFIRLHGVNHNMPFPTATSLHKTFTSFTIFYSFSVLSPKACPYVVMRFAPSLIVAGMNHRISSRFTQIPRDSTRRLFVEICVNSWQKNLRKNIRVIRGICGFKGSHKLAQIFTNYLWAKWPVSQ